MKEITALKLTWRMIRDADGWTTKLFMVILVFIVYHVALLAVYRVEDLLLDETCKHKNP